MRKFKIETMLSKMKGQIWRGIKSKIVPKKRYFFFALLIQAVVKIFFRTVVKVVCIPLLLKEMITDRFIAFSIVYQPLLVTLSLALFADKTDLLVKNFLNGQANSILIIAQILKILTVIFLTNAYTELMIRIFHKDEESVVDTFYGIQEKSNDYMMMGISLIALYAAAKPNSGEMINTWLLAFGIIVFLSILVLTLYKKLFLETKLVETAYLELMKKYTESEKK